MNALINQSCIDLSRPISLIDVADAASEVFLPNGVTAALLPLGPISVTDMLTREALEATLGSAVFFPAANARSLRIEGRSEVIVINIDACLAGTSLEPSKHPTARLPNKVTIANSPSQISAIAQLAMKTTFSSEAPEQEELASMATLLVDAVAQSDTKHGGRANRSRRSLGDAQIRSIDRFVECHLEDQLRLSQLASLTNLGSCVFLRRFKDVTGTSPFQYVILKRVNRARRMLQYGTESIAEIAYATGFSSQSHLTMAFKRYFATTPGAFKRDNRLAA